MKILDSGYLKPTFNVQTAQPFTKTSQSNLNLSVPIVIEDKLIRFGHTPEQKQQEVLLKEINEQPKVLLNLTQKALEGKLFEGLDLPQADQIQSVAAVAEGSSYNALAIAKDQIEALNQRPFSILLPHDVESKLQTAKSQNECPTQLFPKNPLWLTVSQSGKSSNLVEALGLMGNSIYRKDPKDFPITIFTNHPEEKLGQLYGEKGKRKVTVGLEAGDENSVPATKSMTSSIMALLLFGNYLAKQTGRLSEGSYKKNLSDLHQVSTKVSNFMNQEGSLANSIHQFAQQLADSNYYVLLSRGPMTKIMPEVALKLRESSRNVTFFDNSDSFKHGSAPILSGTKQGQNTVMPNMVYWVPNQPELAQQLYNDVKEHFYKGGNPNQKLFNTNRIFFIRTENTPAPPEELKKLIEFNPKHELVLPNTKDFKSATENQFLGLTAYHLIAHALCKVKNVSPNDVALSKVVLNPGS